MRDQSQGYGWWQATNGWWYPPEEHPEYRPFPPPADPASARSSGRLAIGLLLAVLFVATLVGSVLSDSDERPRNDAAADDTGDTGDRFASPLELAPGVVPVPRSPTIELPAATLTVFDDGCGVIRVRSPVDPEGLTWNIVDTDGFQVLQRNASGETHYRYFQSGVYDVVLEAWDGTGYASISNTVTIRC